MRPLAVEMNHVKLYRNAAQPVLNIGHLSLRQGELAAIAGPNGAGKSTLLQVISLLARYQEGELRLFGTDALRTDPLALRRRCAMVFQDTLLLNDTVFNNVALALRFRGVNGPTAEQEVKAALTAFHCLHLAERAALHLSGGEARRVCLARAMVHKPELLLLDEPFSSLDAPTRSALLSDLKEAARNSGMTVVLVSHNFDEILQLAERAIVLLDGQIAQDDLPEAILRRPATRSVADLVGMDNLIPCAVERDQGLVVRLCNDMKFPYDRAVPHPAAICCLPGDAFTVSTDPFIRPKPQSVVMNAVVRSVVPGIGTDQLCLEAQGLRLLVRVPCSHGGHRITTGTAVTVAFQPADVHILYG